MSKSDREALPHVREWSDSTPGCPGVVGRLSRMTGSGWETFSNIRDALMDIREWSEGSPRFPKVVGRPSLMSGSGWESLRDV